MSEMIQEGQMFKVLSWSTWEKLRTYLVYCAIVNKSPVSKDLLKELGEDLNE